jgi:hypothetical protein
MFRSIVLAALIGWSIFQVNAARAQQAPPLCPQGSWAMRSNGGWTCSKAVTPPDNPSTDKSSSSTRGHGHRGGMPQ